MCEKARGEIKECFGITWIGEISFSTAGFGHGRWLTREAVLYFIDVDRALQVVLLKHYTTWFHALEWYYAVGYRCGPVGLEVGGLVTLQRIAHIKFAGFSS